MVELVMHSPLSKAVTTYISALSHLERASDVAQLDLRYEKIKPPIENGIVGPRTVYIFDTNVCRSFLDPRENIFLDAAGVSGLFTASYGDTVERMTLRYMFHGLLPGQDKEPIFLTPTHWNELLNQTEVLLRKGGRSANHIQHNLSENTLARLRSAGSPEELVQLAEELQVAKALQELGDAINLVKRTELLFGERDEIGRVRRLDHATSSQLSHIWTEASNLVSWRVESDWRRAISISKQEVIRTRPASRSARQREVEMRRHQMAVRNDAASMALIETLYLVDPFAGGQNPSRQYLFVTSDKALIDAYEAQKDRLEQNGIPNFVRSPASFMPFAHYEYFHRVMTSQPDTSKSYEETSAKIHEALLSLRSVARNSQWHQLTTKRISELRSNWNDAANLLSIVGNERFVDDFSEHDTAEKVRRTYEYLSYEKIGPAIEEEIQAKMGLVTARHEKASVEAALRQLPDRLRPAKEGTSDPRAPIHFLATDVLYPLRDQEITQCKNLSDFLKELRIDAAGPGEETKKIVEFLIGRWKVGALPSTEIIILTALLFTCAGLWTVALECAHRARRKERDRVKNGSKWPGRGVRRKRAYADTKVMDAAYIGAVCMRMTLRTEEQYRDATNLLNENITARQHNTSATSVERLSDFRDRIEKDTLILTAAVLQCMSTWLDTPGPGEFQGRSFMAETDIARDYDDAIERLEDLAEVLHDDYLGREKSEFDVTVPISLILRARSNALAAMINRHFLPPLRPGPDTLGDIEHASIAIREIRQEYNGFLPARRNSQDIYLKIADFLTGTASASQDFDGLMDDFKIVRNSQVAAVPDHDEMEFLQQMIQAVAHGRGIS